MTSMDKTRTPYTKRIRKGNVYVVIAEDPANQKQYIVKVFSNHASACDFVDMESSDKRNLPFVIQKWAIT